MPNASRVAVAGEEESLWKFAAFVVCCQRKNLQPGRTGIIMDVVGGDCGDY